MANTAEVASHKLSPPRSAAIQSPSGTRTPEVVPFQANTRSRSARHCGEIGQRAVVGLERAQVLEPQLVARVDQPALAEALPGEDVDAAGAEQVPHRELERAGVRAGDDADPVVVRQAEQGARSVQHLGEALLGDR